MDFYSFTVPRYQETQRMLVVVVATALELSLRVKIHNVVWMTQTLRPPSRSSTTKLVGGSTKTTCEQILCDESPDPTYKDVRGGRGRHSKER